MMSYDTPEAIKVETAKFGIADVLRTGGELWLIIDELIDEFPAKFWNFIIMQSSVSESYLNIV